MHNLKTSIDNFLKQQHSVIDEILCDTSKIIEIIDCLTKARDNGKKIFTMGNGGSASTASHFTSDLLKTAILKDGKRFQSISLVDNIPVILAWSNDTSFDEVFLEQLKNHLLKGDIIIGFSGSGNSANIIKSFQYGKKHGATCIGFTGKSGGKLKNYCDICLRIPSDDMLAIESHHLMLCHCIINAIRGLGNPLFKYR